MSESEDLTLLICPIGLAIGLDDCEDLNNLDLLGDRDLVGVGDLLDCLAKDERLSVIGGGTA